MPMDRSPRSRFAPVAASFVAVLALGLAACGGDDDDADGTAVTDVTSSEGSTDTADTADTAGDDTVTSDTTETDADSSTPAGGTASGEVGTEEEYVEATSAAIPWDDEEMSDCAAVALIDAIGYDQITDAGITVEQFSTQGPGASGLTIDEDSLTDVSSEVAACGDVLAQLTTGMDDDQRICVEDNLDNEQLAELLVAPLFQLDPSDEVVAGSEAVDACIGELTATSVAS